MWRVVLVVSLVLWSGGAAGQTAGQQDLRAEFAAAKSAGVIWAVAAVEKFYAARNYRPAWFEQGSEAIRELRVAIGSASDHGLTASDYHLAALGRAIASGRDARADILATDAYLTFAAHLRNGRLNPVTLQPVWTIGSQADDLIRHLEETLRTGHIERRLDSLAPRQRVYRNLKKALRLYRDAASAKRWPVVPAGPTLRPGMDDPRVAVLRQRLRAAKLLPAGGGEETTLYDKETEQAVVAFQKRSGLETDGLVGRKTLHELNRTLDQRVAQIRANLERLRWLPDRLGPRHIRVNVADYRLEAWASGRMVRTYNVIVGLPYRKTPIFSAEISYLIFNPWWFTPASIARHDKVYDFQKDPSTIQRLGYEITDLAGNRLDPTTVDWNAYSEQNFPFRIRQRPGPLNALGRVKLMLPNRYNVYLHDTPSQELFQRNQRSFSSGCVRVKHALDLAQWALADMPGWDRARIDTVVASGRETRVNLTKRIPVHFLYLTAVGERDGSFRFVNDIYDRDARVIAGLDLPPPRRGR